MARVLLVDDHASFRQPLGMLLAREADLDVVAHAGTVEEARAITLEFDVAVVDLVLPDGSGADLVAHFRRTHPSASILVLTSVDDPALLARAVEAGAGGLLHKSAGVGEVIEAVRRAAAGEPLLHASEIVEMLRIASRSRERDRDAQRALQQLTPRELDVLEALGDGLSDKGIAERLNIHPQTARTHMVNILSKLGVDSRLQALVFAVRHGAVRIR